ncbi:hypothetical protein ACHQM5_026731 [Ranunculus cassubicifolius]
MADSPRNNKPQEPQKRLCDFCTKSKALVYCRADSAKLCFNCDREVHSTNPLFTKHTRSPLCDICDSNPASILCSTENLVLCQNCDWDSHDNNRSLTTVHDRRPIEGFTGCPSGVDLCSILGIDDIRGKCLFSEVDDYLVDGTTTGGVDEYSDSLVWDAQPIFSIDDLIGSTDLNQNFQATGNPPLPKNRNTVCGKYKEEILSQLRSMVKLESCYTNDNEDFKSFLEFQPLVPDLPPGITGSCLKHYAEPVPYAEYLVNEYKWDLNSSEAEVQVPVVPIFTEYTGSNPQQTSSVDKSITDDGAVSKSEFDNNLSDQVTRDAPFNLPKLALHKSVIQDRGSSISRYKEKKKTRRYDHHIRYESRKARAEGRSRVRGRFAKAEN